MLAMYFWSMRHGIASSLGRASCSESYIKSLRFRESFQILAPSTNPCCSEQRVANFYLVFKLVSTRFQIRNPSLSPVVRKTLYTNGGGVGSTQQPGPETSPGRSNTSSHTSRLTYQKLPVLWSRSFLQACSRSGSLPLWLIGSTALPNPWSADGF